MRLFQHILVLTLLLIQFVLYSQQYYSENFTLQDGLPSNSCRALYKDSRGILWIGTDAGVCSYDGHLFQTLDIKELLGAKVWAIEEDGNHNLWFGTFGNGVFKYDGQNFEQYKVENGLPSNEIRVIKYFSQYDLLLIGGEEGFSKFEGENFKLIQLPESSVQIKIMDFVSFDNKIYAFPYKNSIYTYDPQNEHLAELSTNLFPFRGNACSVLKIDDDSYAQSTGRDGFYVFNKAEENAFSNTGQVFGIDIDDNKKIWFSSWMDKIHMETLSGLFLCINDTIKHFNPLIGIDDCIGWDVLYDKSDRCVWFTTLDQGLFRIPILLFENLDPAFFNLESLKVNDLLFDKSEDAIWIASHDNVFQVTNMEVQKYSKEDMITLFVEHLRKSSIEVYRKWIDTDPYWNKYENLSPEMIADTFLQYQIDAFKGFDCIGSDQEGNIYVSSKFGFYKFDKELNIDASINIPYGNFVFNSGDTLINCSRWSNSPFIKFDIDEDRTNLLLKKNNSHPRNCNKIVSHKDDVWYACIYDGLFWSRHNRFVHLNKIDSTICKTINDVCFDAEGNTIVGANDGEIYILTFDGDLLNFKYRFGAENGIVGNSIKWVLADHDNFLWIGTDKGLNRLNLNQLYETGAYYVNYFNEKDGFNNYAGKNPVIDKDGVIWLGTDNGIIKINPEILKNLSFNQQKITLNDIHLFNQKLDWDSISKIDQWTQTPLDGFQLKYDQNYLTFYFDVNNLSDNNKDLFSYKLEGAEKDWTRYSSNRSATYSHLNPGHYTFYVRSRNLNTNVAAVPLELNFIIKRPWWQTWWFYLILGILSIGIIRFYTWRQVNKAKEKGKQKAKFEKQISELKIQALQSQMNPHFVFNALNSIQGFIIENNVDEALRYLSDFSKILRQTLDNASKRYISLNEEIEYLKRYLNLEKMRFEDQLISSIQVDKELDVENVLIPPMILQPFVENAIKHGLLHKEGVGRLEINISKKDKDYFICTIKDNGIGREKSEQFKKEVQEYTIKGTRLTQDRINLLNNTINNAQGRIYFTDLKNKYGEATGTIVSIEFPFI